jgi:hypothetical protein
MIFYQYCRHPEANELRPNGDPCTAGTAGLLRRFSIYASGPHLIGKETERSWERDDDISKLMPSLVQYQHHGSASEPLRKGCWKFRLLFWSTKRA